MIDLEDLSAANEGLTHDIGELTGGQDRSQSVIGLCLQVLQAQALIAIAERLEDLPCRLQEIANMIQKGK